MNRRRLRAEHAAQGFYQRRQNEPLEALAGDGAGNVEVTGRLNWIYVRISGDANRVMVAYNASAYEFYEDDSLTLQWVKRTGLGYYEVIGYGGSVVYDVGGTGGGGSFKSHAWQHERRDFGYGGHDPVDVFARMIVPLRARPQTTPDMTLHVEIGFNPLTGNKYAGGDSAAFTAPAVLGQSRYDLLYLGDDDALHILQGTAAGTPSEPPMPAGTVPLAYVLLDSSSTTITESMVEDARLIVGFVSTSGGSPPSPLTDEDGAILLDEAGSVLYDEG